QPRPLMDQLVERVLPVCAWLSPINWTGLIIDLSSVKRNVFAIAFHRQLLEVCRKALEVLIIGQDGYRFRAKEVVVPDGQQAHDHGQVWREWGSAKVLVHFMEPVEHSLEVIRAHGQHR